MGWQLVQFTGSQKPLLSIMLQTGEQKRRLLWKRTSLTPLAQQTRHMQAKDRQSRRRLHSIISLTLSLTLIHYLARH